MYILSKTMATKAYINKMSCDLCGDYTCLDEIHNGSFTHEYNVYLEACKICASKADYTADEQIEAMNDKCDYENEYKDDFIYQCRLPPKMGRTDFQTENLRDAINYEREAMGFSRDAIAICQVEKPIKRKLYSSETATCESCGKVYTHNSKTMKPKVALNRHKKTCSGNRKKVLRNNIIGLLDGADEETLFKIFSQIKNLL